MAEEYAEPFRAIFSDSAPDDDAVQGDGLAVTTLQPEQAHTVDCPTHRHTADRLHPRRKGQPADRWPIIPVAGILRYGDEAGPGG